MDTIRIRGARTHNLKAVNLDLPRDALIVITGPSGSGKSSLAFDTLYAEGQRRYVESLSAYARQFLAIMDKPDVDHIEGLSPAISIEQKATSHNPRSTVGTITEIYDYLRLLYARVGTPHCPNHGVELHARTISQMVDQVLTLPTGSRLMLLAPVVQERKGEHIRLLEDLRVRGFIRARVDGKIVELDSPPVLDPSRKHTIEVVVDRFKVRTDLGLRLAESLETALQLSEGIAIIAFMDKTAGPELLFSANFACPLCGYSVSELEPRLFSFNNPAGACTGCDGLGVQQFFDPQQVVVDPHLSSPQPCRHCEGTRLNLSARHVLVAGTSLPQITALTVGNARAFFAGLQLPGKRGKIAANIIREIGERLDFLVSIGLGYLSLDRGADTLSGGETQRIRLASQIGAGLVGVMYVLDEPSIGLHQRDNARLIGTLKRLRDLGNTVIVVEHDEETIRVADHIVDMGPGAGVHGGQIVAEGTPTSVIANANSITGQYLSGRREIATPTRRVPPDRERMVRILGARGNNLKSIDVEIPLGLLTCVTGVSGSGKSTLIRDTLHRYLARELLNANEKPAPCREILGLEHLDKVINIDQSPIGRTPRSNPATYTGLFTPLRELFAATQEARSRGYTPGRFSFNVKGGRCEACQGDGLIKVEMHFLPDIYVSCDVCAGQRYNRETLDIRYKGKNIHQVLEMTVEDALAFYNAVPAIARKLKTLKEVGLGYIRLGQNATTLSGGEAQRIKLARELSKRDTGKTLYILDEPTTGLHFHDIVHLLQVLQRLRDHGNTIVVVEHNLDVIKTADWIIDLGPEGGDQGGQVVAVGTPEVVAAQRLSYTGCYLRPLLEKQTMALMAPPVNAPGLP